MIKRLQIGLSDEAWQEVESITKEASENFEVGSISYSDVINEMVLTSKVDVKALQLKHTDVRRFVRSMASQDEVDIDSMIKNLMELKTKTSKRTKASMNTNEVSA